MANQLFEVFAHRHKVLDIVGNQHQREVCNGFRPVNAVLTLQRCEGIIVASEVGDDVPGFQIDKLEAMPMSWCSIEGNSGDGWFVLRLAN